MVHKALQPAVLLNVIAPLVGYQLLHLAGASDLVALTVAAVFPAAAIVASTVRTRRVEPLGLLSLTFIGFGVAAGLLFQDPTVLLVANALPTGAVGLAFLATLLGRRPMVYLIGRQLAARTEAGGAGGLDARWATSAGFRSHCRAMTALWALALLVDMAARVVVALLLPPAIVVPLNPLIMLVVLGPVALHTYRARARRIALS